MCKYKIRLGGVETVYEAPNAHLASQRVLRGLDYTCARGKMVEGGLREYRVLAPGTTDTVGVYRAGSKAKAMLSFLRENGEISTCGVIGRPRKGG